MDRATMAWQSRPSGIHPRALNRKGTSCGRARSLSSWRALAGMLLFVGAAFGIAPEAFGQDNTDPPVLSIANASVTEGSTANFTVSLNAASTEEVTVGYSTSNGTATTDSTAVGGADYTARTGQTLTFAAGTTTDTITVSTTDDSTDEPDETFDVTLSNPMNATLGVAEATGTIEDNDAAPTLSIADASATEGSNVNFTVTLSAVSAKTVTASYNTSNDTATTSTSAIGGADYTARTSQTLTFAAGTTTATITVSTTDDSTDEPDETFDVTLSNPMNATLGVAEATGTIEDNDAAPTLSIANASATEGSGLVFTVTLSAVSGKTVTVKFNTSDDTATTSTTAIGGADYTARTNQTLTIAAGATAGTITVLTGNDGVDEDDETLKVTLSSPTNATLGSATEATGTINDNDAAPTVAIANARATEGSSVSFTVSLSAASVRQVTVGFSTSDGTATTSTTAIGGADYTARTNQTLTIAAGTTQGTITVSTGDDETDEVNETFTVTLSSPTNATLASMSSATGTIDDDDAAPTVSIDDGSATEGSAVAFRVALSAVSGKTISMNWATSDVTASSASGAPGGADYTAVAATALQFAAGDTAKTVTVSTRAETVDERDETFTVTLSSPSNVTLSDGTATGTIEDDDATPTVTLALSSASIDEDDESSGVTATLNHPSGFATTVTVSYTAVSPAVAADLSQTGTTLTIAAGATASTGTVTLTPVDNETDAPDKTVTVSATASNELGVNAPANRTLTIEDDDPAPVVMLVLAPSSISEDEARSTVTASLDRPSSEETTVTVSSAAVSPAVAGDYTQTGTSLTIAAGATTSTGTVTLASVDNETDAPDKTVTVSATASNTQGIAGNPAAVTLTIQDDDPAPTVTLSLSDDSISELDGTTTVSGSLNHPSSEATVVTIAASANNYTVSAGGVLTIAAGAITGTGTVTLTPVDNTTDAPDNELTVNATAVNTQGIEQPAGVALTIEDDDPAPTVTLSLSAAAIAEETGSAMVTARLSHPSSEDTSVVVATAAGDPKAAEFVLTNATLTIVAGTTESSTSATVTPTDNNVDAPDQSVTVSATASNTQGIAGDPESLTLTITDDEDAPGVTLGLSAAAITEEEGSTTVTAQLSHPSSEDTTVTVTATVTATEPAVPEDIVQTGTLLTIPAGTTDSTGTVTVSGVPNFVDAPDKTATVAGTALNTQGIAGNPESVTLTITDDDVRGFTFDPEALTVPEDETTANAFSIVLTSQPTENLNIALRLSGSDELRFLQRSSGGNRRVFNIRFTTENWNVPQFVTVNTADDTDAANDVWRLELQGRDGDYAGHTDYYTITVVDDERKAEGILLTVNRGAVVEDGGAVTINLKATIDGTPRVTATPVSVTISGDTAAETDFAVSSSTFTMTIPANADSVDRDFTLTPAPDRLDEDDETISITGTTTATVEGTTTVLTVSPASVTITDDDRRGVTVSPRTLDVRENGSATYTVVLDSQPTGDVNVSASVSGAGLSISPSSLTFTTEDWNVRQTVTVSAEDDADTADGSGTVTHTVTGADYAAVTASTVALRTRDDDGVGVRASTQLLDVPESGESIYTIVLDARPATTVTVSPSVTGDPDVTVTPPTLVFTTQNWNVPQEVTVKAEDDGDGRDDAATVSHTVSGVATRTVDRVQVEVHDDDEASTAIVLTVSPPEVPEDGGSHRVTVTAAFDGAALETDTEVTVLVRNGTASATDFAANPSALALTIPADQVSASGDFELTATDDPLDEGEGETVVVSGSVSGSTLAVTPATVTIVDDDGRGLTASPSLLRVTEQDRATYTVRLVSQPTGLVTVTPSVTDNDDVMVTPASLEFNTQSWDVARTVTVSAANDTDGDDETATVIHTASGADYEGVAGARVAVTVEDNDALSESVRLTADVTSLREDEGPRTVRVTAAVDGAARPEDTAIEVAVTGGTASATDFTASPANFTVTIPANSTRASETFTLTPLDDAVLEADETVRLTGTTVAGLRVDGTTLEIVDDETPAIRVSTESVAVTEESSVSYTVALATEPAGTVTVRVTVSENRHVTVEPASLTFGPGTWNVAQTVTAAADDDAGHDTAELRHMGSGADYEGVSGDGVTVTVTDNDTRGVTVSEGAITVREGGSGNYTVVLDTLPSGTVTVRPSVTGDGDVTVMPALLSFTAATWNQARTVTILAAQDTDPTDDAATVAHVVGGADYGENGVTAGDVQVTVEDDDKTPGLVRLAVSPERVTEDGGPATVTVTATLSGETRTTTTEVAVTVAGGTAYSGADFVAVPGFTVTIPAGEAEGTGTFRLVPIDDSVDEDAGETLTVSGTAPGFTVTPASLTLVDDDVVPTEGDRPSPDTVVGFSVAFAPEDPVLLSVADASVREGANTTLDFVVRLNRPREGETRVHWATRDGTASAGSDYVAASGTLRFGAGDTEQTVRVAVLDDAVDEGRETLTLVLTNPVGAGIGDGTALGTIENADPMPRAWLARFGRTVAGQVIEAAEGRFRAARQPGAELALAGWKVGDGAASGEVGVRGAGERVEALAARLRHGHDEGEPIAWRAAAGRDVLMGTAFALTAGTRENGLAGLWGRGASMRFDGAGDVALDGDVGTGLLGADWKHGRLAAGVMVSHSRGDGVYRSPPGGGKVESVLTGFFPYGRVAVSEKLSLWGVGGYGAGTLTLTPTSGASMEADTDLALGALGLRGLLVGAPAGVGAELVVKSDALGVWTSSDETRDLASARGETVRLRLGLEGTWRGLDVAGGRLTPSLEVGLRHDSGDAETGFGADVGGGVAWSDPGLGITVEARGRGLVVHSDESFRERGFTGSLAWDADPFSERGLSLSLSQTLGTSEADGTDALLTQPALWRSAAGHGGGDGPESRKLEAVLAYGLPMFGSRFTGTPEVGLALLESARETSLGWRLRLARHNRNRFDLRLRGTHRQAANDDNRSEYRVELGLAARW